MGRYYVYIMSSNTGTLYVGVTNNLERRVNEHKLKIVPGFTSKYNVHNLIFFHEFSDINQAIELEKKIKGWSRSKKISLVKSLNPILKDLFEPADSSALPLNDK